MPLALFHPMLRREAAAYLLAAALFLPQPASSQTAYKDLKAHKATYELTTDPSSTSADVTSVSGVLLYEMERTACDWFRSSTSMTLTSQFKNGRSVVTTTNWEIHEKADGSEMKFRAKDGRDGKVTNVSEGSAARTESGLTVRLRAPVARVFDAGAGVDFNLQQSLRIIDAALENRKEVSTRIYDGSEGGQKVFRVTTRIGEMTRTPNALAGDQVSAWPVRILYFADRSTASPVAEPPEYEISGLIQEDGIFTDMRLSFGQLVIKGGLANIVPMASPNCE